MTEKSQARVAQALTSGLIIVLYRACFTSSKNEPSYYGTFSNHLAARAGRIPSRADPYLGMTLETAKLEILVVRQNLDSSAEYGPPAPQAIQSYNMAPALT